MLYNDSPKVIINETSVFLLSPIAFVDSIRTRYRVCGLKLNRVFDILACILSKTGSDRLHTFFMSRLYSIKNVCGKPPLYPRYQNTVKYLSNGTTDIFVGGSG